MEKDLLIKPDGRAIKVSPANGTDYSLKELQGFVGGLIQICRGKEKIYVVNDEGKLMGLPINGEATIKAHRDRAIPSLDFFVGNVLVTLDERVK